MSGFENRLPGRVRLRDAVRGALLGIALGDAAGLATEGLSRRRLERFHPTGIPGPSLLLGRWGMISDDGEHACMTAQALVVSAGEPRRFARSLAWRLRFWLLGLPAGIGLATGRAIGKLWLGFPPHASGVFSAGNGPAMRAPVIGAAWHDDLATLKTLVTASTRLTHSDPKADWGALAVALATALSARGSGSPPSPADFVSELTNLLNDPAAREFLELIAQAATSAQHGESAATFADRLGLTHGVSGYMLHTVPVVLQIWLRAPASFAAGVTEVIQLGGDTDTTAAILGGVLGAGVGTGGLPEEWSRRLVEWPRSRSWMMALADRVAAMRETGMAGSAQPLFWPALPVRNLLFLAVVLLHGLRRLLPPW